jgi:hypothetical protein
MIIDTWTCGKCAKIGQRRKGTDRYCVGCRRAYNAKRSTPDAKKARADSYYWNVHVPQLKSRLEKKYPMRAGKLGVFYPSNVTNDSGNGMTYRRLTQENYDTMLDMQNG